MKWMVDYRYITHLNCIMKRHTWVNFRELKYQCQWTQYRHIPQHWLTPVKHLRFTVHTEACATVASLWINWTELGYITTCYSSISSHSAAAEWEVMKGFLFLGAAGRAELQLQKGNASTVQRVCASAQRQGDSEVLQMEARINACY